MADTPRNPDDDAAPETVNREQQDEEAQAQDVADAARHSRLQEDSDKSPSNGEGDDAQDLVDHMRQMTRSGRIDMDAFRGERSDDDEDGELGPGGVEDDAPRGAP
ncbi:MAG: hypothetical protein HEQ22_02665 [Sphingopyxis sp.]|uniref:hypothetical protein n=1 Tax=Sphingopyxis sp. TaxID=1908224 RepID=UPI003D80B483